ncbi:MAG: trypsin-like peptidase domain-containing protein [Candidatus Zixiibacteriota bacterium]|nr:MAG: trypsin-like peptidase domain-containing protein [candidate division Zixibacteria bacterium]
MANFKTTLVTVIIGGALGAGAMLWFLRYLDSEKPGREMTVNREAQSDRSFSDLEGTSEGRDDISRLESATSDIDLTRRNAIVRAADRVAPAVVSLSVIQMVKERSGSPFGRDFWDFLFLPPPTRERPVLSQGSGVVINPEGYILTNDHVVGGAKEIRVTLVDGREFPGRLVGTDPVTDLAVVKIISDSANHFPNGVLGDSDDLIIGEWAIAIGNPFGYLLDDPKPTVTVGVISAINRDIKLERGQTAVYRNMIQTDASINPGNSGGPLVNALGEVIGINTFIFTSSRGSEGIGFAVPINRAKMIISDLLRYGEVVKAWIGINVRELTPREAVATGYTGGNGLYITSISDLSPASRAGIKPGDILYAVGQTEIRRLSDWAEVVNYARADRALGFGIVRDSNEISLVVVPEEVPINRAPRKTDKFGLEALEITPKVKSYMGIRGEGGIMVYGADDSTTAAAWGLRKGDIIYQIGRHRLTGLDDYINIMSQIGKGHKLIFTMERDGRVSFLRVRT